MAQICEDIILPGTPFPSKRFAEYLEGLENFKDDTEARENGLDTHDHYFISIQTDSGFVDTLKRVSPLP
jgi:hypothetical protein